MPVKIFLSFLLSFIFFFSKITAQCSIVSGEKGIIQDSSKTTVVNYMVTIKGDGSFTNLYEDESCGFRFPAIVAPWSGNSDTKSYVTYTFSEPIASIKVFIAYTGVDGDVQAESFQFTTNGSTPELIVNSGNCVKWKVNANYIVSPSINTAVNALVTVKSSQSFTTLTIVTGDNSSRNGGSSYGLCSTSLVKNNELVIKLNDKEISYSTLTIFDENGQVDIKEVTFNTDYWIRDPSGKETKVLVEEVIIDGKNTLIKLIAQ